MPPLTRRRRRRRLERLLERRRLERERERRRLRRRWERERERERRRRERERERRLERERERRLERERRRLRRPPRSLNVFGTEDIYIKHIFFFIKLIKTMVSMYPNTQAEAYIVKDGVFTPCPQPMPCASNCPPCMDPGHDSFVTSLKKLGYEQFAEIVILSGLKDLDCKGITVFVPTEGCIKFADGEKCDKLTAVNIVKASSMKGIIPSEVLGQRIEAKYPSLCRAQPLLIRCTPNSIHVNGVAVCKTNKKNNKTCVHEITQMMSTKCIC
jgi:exonuclease VII large subunit